MIWPASSATGAESIRRGRAIDTGNSSSTRPGRLLSTHHPVPEPDRLAHVVGDEQDGQVPLGGDPVELVVQHVPGHRVERAERLVHQQHVRVLGERAGQRDPLPHAAGQLVRALGAEPAEPHDVEQLAGPLAALGAADAAGAQRQLDVGPGA